MTRDSFAAIEIHHLAFVIGGAAASRPSASRLDPQIKATLTKLQDGIQEIAAQGNSSSSSAMMPMMMMMMMKKK